MAGRDKGLLFMSTSRFSLTFARRAYNFADPCKEVNFDWFL